MGEHLKVKRCSLKLFQRDVAQLLGVSEATLLLWEKGYAEPAYRSFPAIVAFLGTDPSPPPTTLGERLKAKRRALGFSIDELAEFLGVDPSTAGDWERGRIVLYQIHRKRLAEFLGVPEREVVEPTARAWGNCHRKNRQKKT